MQLYIDGEYIGDAEIVSGLNEAGDLAQMLRGSKVHFPLCCKIYCSACTSQHNTMGLSWSTFTAGLSWLHTHTHTHTHTNTHTHTHTQKRMSTDVCQLCQGQGFVVCLWCQGSKKGIRNSFNDLKCTVCNKNALQVCPECSL